MYIYIYIYVCVCVCVCVCIAYYLHSISMRAPGRCPRVNPTRVVLCPCSSVRANSRLPPGIYLCLRMCVCVCEKERERERERVCVSVCGCK